MSGVFDNLLNSTQLSTNLAHGAQVMDDILTEHAGPFAFNCIIGQRFRQANGIDEFTKDGIKIMANFIVSDDPIDRLIARLARFVGFAVDARCHDGTTTSMMTFCRLAKLAAQNGIGATDTSDQLLFSQELTEALEQCLTIIDDVKITSEDIAERAKTLGLDVTEDDVREAIAYHMAMISSKGDTDLASKIATIVRNTPKQIVSMFKNETMVTETHDRYVLEKQPYDLAVHANAGNQRYYNYKSDTQIRIENCAIFATGKEIVKGSMESEFLNSLISPLPAYRTELSSYGLDDGWEDIHKGKKNLVILCDSMSDPDLIMHINRFNESNRDVQIYHFHTQVAMKMRKSFDCTLHYMAGAELFKDVCRTDPLASFVGLHDDSNVVLELIGHTMKLYNLYDKDGTTFHPYYEDPDLFEPYTQFRKETEELMEFAQKNITHHALDHDEVTFLSMLYRALVCQEVWDIRIGGMAHEQSANSTVYEDAMGAALSAVDDGVVLCGYMQIAERLRGLPTRNTTQAYVINIMQSIFETSVRIDKGRFNDLNLEDLGDKWSYYAADKKAYVRKEDHVYLGELDKDGMSQFISMNVDKPVLIQAWAGFHEQLHRFKDIVPRLALTAHLADMRVENASSLT